MKRIFLSVMLICLWVVRVEAGEIVRAQYKAHGTIMHLMDADFLLETQKGVFQVNTTTRARGMLSWLVKSKTFFATSGKIKKNQYADINYSSKTIDKNYNKERQVSFKEKKGYIDYQTALLYMMDLKEPTTKSYDISDGTRDMKITFDYVGTKELPAKKEYLFSGAADYYRVSIEIISGKRRGWFFNRMGDKENPPLHFYFGKVDGYDKKVLVKAEFDTSLFGTIAIDLLTLEVEKTK
jgi:hypothetical protein